ncbi:MAG: L-threonine 3-dehydrogenase, partial [Chloroflexota bacterium]|nr:L-threonine 3-dehydrogenase [Chloroflexota bacterium]
RISLFGMNARALPAIRQNTITRNELTVFGSYVGVNTFPRAIQVLERGVIHPSVLISHRVPLR